MKSTIYVHCFVKIGYLVSPVPCFDQWLLFVVSCVGSTWMSHMNVDKTTLEKYVKDVSQTFVCKTSMPTHGASRVTKKRKHSDEETPPCYDTWTTLPTPPSYNAVHHNMHESSTLHCYSERCYWKRDTFKYAWQTIMHDKKSHTPPCYNAWDV